MPSFGLNHQIKAVKREIGFRKHVYDRRVEIGKMKQDEADYQIEIMEKVLITLTEVVNSREFKLE